MASADTLLKEARRALDAGRLAAATAFVDQALAKKLDARHGEALFDLGNLLSERNEPAVAAAVFERALQLFPGHPVGTEPCWSDGQSRIGTTMPRGPSFPTSCACSVKLIDR